MDHKYFLQTLSCPLYLGMNEKQTVILMVSHLGLNMKQKGQIFTLASVTSPIVAWNSEETI